MNLEYYRLKEFNEIAKKHDIPVVKVAQIFKMEFEFLKAIITEGNNETILLKGFGGFTLNKTGAKMKTKKDFNSEEEFMNYMRTRRDEKVKRFKDWVQKSGKKTGK